MSIDAPRPVSPRVVPSLIASLTNEPIPTIQLCDSAGLPLPPFKNLSRARRLPLYDPAETLLSPSMTSSLTRQPLSPKSLASAPKPESPPSTPKPVDWSNPMAILSLASLPSTNSDRQVVPRQTNHRVGSALPRDIPRYFVPHAPFWPFDWRGRFDPDLLESDAARAGFYYFITRALMVAMMSWLGMEALIPFAPAERASLTEHPGWAVYLEKIFGVRIIMGSMSLMRPRYRWDPGFRVLREVPWEERDDEMPRNGRPGVRLEEVSDTGPWPGYF